MFVLSSWWCCYFYYHGNLNKEEKLTRHDRQNFYFKCDQNYCYCSIKINKIKSLSDISILTEMY